MNPWLQLVADSQAAQGRHPQPADGIVTPLTALGLIAATGDDAPSFLHNQLTNDVDHLGSHEARLAGYCSPKGRLLATFLYWKQGGDIMLQLARPIQPSVQKRLQMFVLRAKAVLRDATDEYALIGLAGPGALRWLETRFTEIPTAPYTVAAGEPGTLIRLPDAAIGPRFQLTTRPDSAVAFWPDLCATLTLASESAWRLMDIQAGVPQIVAQTQEQFVPQMINFELIGGVNFRKGCYPGQEIVARSQYLGKLKRRTLLASGSGVAVAPGTEVFSEADPAQPCGMIVNAEPNDGAFECLVEIKLSAMDAGAVRVGAPDGPALRFKDLPYPLVEQA